MEAYRHVPGFATAEELRRLRQAVAEREDLFTDVHGRGGLGPRYRVIDGDQIHDHLPAVEAFGVERVRPLAEQFAGNPLSPLGSSRRSVRVQAYERRDHGFRWHFDGHPYVVLVLRGGRVLHRGITLADDGERILLAYTYDEPGRKPNPFRDWIARRLNY